MDLYEVLGVPQNATAEEIKKSYRRLAREWHPDNNSLPEATRRMAEINAAYEVLSDPVKRRVYDVELRQPPWQPHQYDPDPVDVSDLFRAVHEAFAPFRAAMGWDVRKPSDPDACPECDGTGSYTQSVRVINGVRILELYPCEECGGSGKKRPQ